MKNPMQLKARIKKSLWRNYQRHNERAGNAKIMEIIRNRKPIRMRYTVGERMLLRKSSSQWALVTRAESPDPSRPAGTVPAKPIAPTEQIDRLPSPVHPLGET